MTIKLNLTINESVARRIKSYAARKNTSVSKIVEKQLEEILNTEKKDTNIIIDFLDPLRPFHNESKILFRMLVESRFKAYYSESVVTTTAYIIRKEFSKNNIYEIIDNLNKRIILLTYSAQYITNVTSILPPDFEDALLYEIALNQQMDYFITSNIKDSRPIQRTNLPVMNVNDFNKFLQLSIPEQ